MAKCNGNGGLVVYLYPGLPEIIGQGKRGEWHRLYGITAMVLAAGKQGPQQ